MFVRGWKESSKSYEYQWLREVLERIPGVRVLIPTYFEDYEKGSRLRSKRTVQEYALSVRDYYLYMKSVYPDAKFLVIGHSLGGIIIRYLHNLGYFHEENMVFIGTPHKGMSAWSFKRPFGLLLVPILRILASDRFYKVPVFTQLLKGSNFLKELNKNGLPQKSIYIGGLRDRSVGSWSSVPSKALPHVWIDCDHNDFLPIGEVNVRTMSLRQLEDFDAHIAIRAVYNIVVNSLK
jgi:pimeloyl-ACP methyl ester carboxylesterase